jgi:hypothetical protein
VPFPLPDAKALKEGVLPKNSRKQKAAADEETAANGSSIQALIAKAVQAKKAMESKSDIAQRLIKTETTSEFAAVFQPVQQGAVHYISTAEMNVLSPSPVHSALPRISGYPRTLPTRRIPMKRRTNILRPVVEKSGMDQRGCLFGLWDLRYG